MKCFTFTLQGYVGRNALLLYGLSSPSRIFSTMWQSVHPWVCEGWLSTFSACEQDAAHSLFLVCRHRLSIMCGRIAALKAKHYHFG